VFRNDEITSEEIAALKPSHIIISPGPGYPSEAGISEALVRALKDEFAILGVCLGHQAICEVMGAAITHAKRLMHGKQGIIKLDTQNPLFFGLPETIKAARYHSLSVKEETLPQTVAVIAKDVDGEIMGVQVKNTRVFGLQFHPESILSPDGKKIIENFLSI
jgi:anthranilate synthase component 2